jgi:hypothetical protein
LLDGAALQEAHDAITVLCDGGDKIEVPLHAFLPVPKVNFEPLVTFGKVVWESVSSAFVELRNDGFREAKWSISWNDDVPLRFEPSSGVLAPKGKFVDLDADGKLEKDQGEFVEGAAGEWTQRVRVEFTAEELGEFRALAKVKIEGQGSKLLDVSATVVEQRIQVMLPNGGGPLTSLHFGALYFGEKREIKAVLVNNGPAPCSFSAAIADRFDINEGADSVTGVVTATGETFIPGRSGGPAPGTVRFRVISHAALVFAAWRLPLSVATGFVAVSGDGCAE